MVKQTLATQLKNIDKNLKDLERAYLYTLIRKQQVVNEGMVDAAREVQNREFINNLVTVSQATSQPSSLAQQSTSTFQNALTNGPLVNVSLPNVTLPNMTSGQIGQSVVPITTNYQQQVILPVSSTPPTTMPSSCPINPISIAPPQIKQEIPEQMPSLLQLLPNKIEHSNAANVTNSNFLSSKNSRPKNAKDRDIELSSNSSSLASSGISFGQLPNMVGQLRNLSGDGNSSLNISQASTSIRHSSGISSSSSPEMGASRSMDASVNSQLLQLLSNHTLQNSGPSSSSTNKICPPQAQVNVNAAPISIHPPALPVINSVALPGLPSTTSPSDTNPIYPIPNAQKKKYSRMVDPENRTLKQINEQVDLLTFCQRDTKTYHCCYPRCHDNNNKGWKLKLRCKTHIESDHLGIKYRCPYCSFLSSRDDNLPKHVVKKHPEKMDEFKLAFYEI